MCTRHSNGSSSPSLKSELQTSLICHESLNSFSLFLENDGFGPSGEFVLSGFGLFILRLRIRSLPLPWLQAYLRLYG